LKALVRVVAAVLYDERGQVLVTQRPPGKSMAGHWEFPGGKVEPGESDAEALRRELREELGIEVIGARLLEELTHDYPERRVVLSVWVVSEYAGVPAALEGQPLHWSAAARLRTLPMLPADWPIVERLETMNSVH
jgi:8-oxo-dGTP diphosphatase